MLKRCWWILLAVGCGGTPADPSASSVASATTVLSASASASSASSKPTSSAATGAAAPGLDETATRGRAFVELLVAKKFEEATAQFDPTMKSSLSTELLQKTWEGMSTAAGPFDRIVGARAEAAGAYRMALVTCLFGTNKLDAKIAFDGEGKVAGLFFVPSTEPYADPSYADRSRFTEREVTVGSGEWALPGTLSVPNGAGPHRAVVLVHGSGPNDRDESGGANKPFKDLAGGLASKGIAVLRYEKRTKVHGAKFPSEATVMEETVEDAILAVELLAKTEGMDPKRIAVVGHSLGGHLAPRIGARSKSIAGIAVLAGNTRSIPNAMLDQVKYISDLDGRRGPEEDVEIAKLTKEVERARELVKPGNTKSEVVLGVHATYWRDLAAYDPIATAKSFGRPIFIAQGLRDYQVTKVDFEVWNKGLAGKSNVTFKTYPSANHLFGAGEGPSAPEEYQRRAEVVPALVEDLALWVGKLP